MFIHSALILLLQANLFNCELCKFSPNYRYSFKLIGYAIKTFQPVPTKEDCAEACTFNRNCRSVNFYKENRTCELNNSTHLLVPGNLLKEPGIEYICVVGLTKLCSDAALGVEDGTIPNTSLSASSSYHDKHVPHGARLNANTFWLADLEQHPKWIQVDFNKTVSIFAIATQGCPDLSQWVTKYIVKYSNDGVNFVTYGNGRVFLGNKDKTSVVKNKMRFNAKAVRICPQDDYGYPSMRLELYGCFDCNAECLQI